VTLTTYQNCGTATNDICRTFFGNAIPVDASQECKNVNGIDQLVTKSGCRWDTTNNNGCDVNSQCSFDSNNLNDNGVCVCKTTGDYCSVGTSISCVAGDDSKILNCSKISGSSCYKKNTITLPSYQKCSNNIILCRNTGTYCPTGLTASCVVGDDSKISNCNLITGTTCSQLVSTSLPAYQKCVSGGSMCREDGIYCATGSASLCINGDDTKIVNCIPISDSKCSQKTTIQLDSNKKCDTGIIKCRTSPDPYCTQGLAPTCSNDLLSKIECIKQTDGCYSKITTSCGDQKCSNGICLSQGCSYPQNPGYVACDINNFENCVDNSCVCKDDANACQLSDYANGVVRCNPDNTNVVQICGIKNNPLITPGVSCYRWSDNITCNTYSACGVQNGIAQCIPVFHNAGIVPSKTEFAIGEEIKGIEIQVTKEFDTDNSGVPVIISLWDNVTNKEIIETGYTRIYTITDNKGVAKIDCSTTKNCFNYKAIRTGTLVVHAIVGDYPNGKYFEASPVNVYAMKTLDVRMTCPIEGKINRDVTCTWTITDKSTGKDPTSKPNIDITLSPAIAFTPSGITGVVFKYDKIGSVVVTVEITANGYMSANQSIAVPINPTTENIVLTIDDNPFSSVDTYTVGSHTISVKLDQSGIPITDATFSTTIRTPAGGIEPIVFTADSNNPGTYVATYNFVEEGKVYTLGQAGSGTSGQITFSDLSKQPLTLSYNINTAKSVTSDLGGLYTTIVVSGIVVGLIFVIFIAIFFIVRKKRKK
jgi:hypothetical protein